jgi:hypothetical protein
LQDANDQKQLMDVYEGLVSTITEDYKGMLQSQLLNKQATEAAVSADMSALQVGASNILKALVGVWCDCMAAGGSMQQVLAVVTVFCKYWVW